MSKEKNKLIYLYLKGGLGNQLSQYNYCSYLVNKYNYKLNIDISYYKTDSYNRESTLLNLLNNLELKKISKKKLFLLKLNRKRYFYFLYSFISKKISIVNDFCYQNLNNFSNHLLIDGYFQGFPHLCDNFASELRNNLKKNSRKILISQNLKEEVSSSSELVVLHVRGKDYINRKANKKLYFSLDKNYYNKALAIIERKKEIKKLLIITDDKDHAANLFSDIKREYLIQSNNEFTDFWIFSNAKNIIIANSSFSYWGARLNHLKDLKVV